MKKINPHELKKNTKINPSYKSESYIFNTAYDLSHVPLKSNTR